MIASANALPQTSATFSGYSFEYNVIGYRRSTVMILVHLNVCS